MDKLLLTPGSIGYFSLLLMCGMIFAYLFVVQKKLADENRRKPMRILGGVFGGVGILVFLFFVQEAAYTQWAFFGLYLKSFVLALVLWFLLQFAYHFPGNIPSPRIECRIMSVASLVYAGYELYLAGLRFRVHFVDGTVRYRPENADYVMFIFLVWVILVFIRRMVLASRQAVEQGGIRHLFSPRGREAKTIRSLVGLIFFALGLGVLDFVIFTFLDAVKLYEALFLFGFMAVVSLFISVYINNFPDLVNLRDKLVGMVLATNFVILSVIAWTLHFPLSSPDQYPALDLSHRSLSFVQNSSGGYNVVSGEAVFDENIGAPIPISYEEIVLPFEFPFFGERYSSFYTFHSGLISFGEPQHALGTENRYGPAPAIFALSYPFGGGESEKDSGYLYYQEYGNRVVITWSDFPELVNPSGRHTFQLVLYSDGSFITVFHDVDPDPYQILNNRYTFTWFSGATPGNQVGSPELIAELPEETLSLPPEQGVVVDYQYHIRLRQHKILSPFIFGIIFSSIAIVFWFPLGLEKSILQPIGELLANIERVREGDYSVKMDDEYADELSTIAASFNSVVAELDTVGDPKAMDGQTFTRIFEHSPSAVLIVDKGFHIVYVNKMFVDMTRFAKEEVIGNTPNILTSGKTLMEVYRQLWQTILDGEVWRGEILNQRKNGEEYWAYVVVAPVKNHDQKNSHYVWMIEDITERKEAEEKLVELSITDPLTGIYNRRQLFVLGENVVKHAQRYESPLSIMMLDIDFFKKVNDTYGHPVGDEVLVSLVNTIKGNIRSADIFGRYGGEEFMVILPNTDLNGAVTSAENLRKEVENKAIMTAKGKISITVSIGVCDIQPSRKDFDEIMKGADIALYDVKNTGRNRVSTYSGTAVMPWEL